MAEQEFLNYARDDGGNVSVPRRLRTRRNAPEVELAYITPEEAGILSALKPGTPHRGPMEIPNYDSFDAKGNYTSGAAMSAAESGKHTADTLAAGMDRHQVQDLHAATQAAAAQSQRSGGNFFGNIARGVGSIFGGLPGTIASWASRLDPRKLRMIDGKMMPQSYWSEEEREKRRNQASINTILNRDAPITDLTHKRLAQLGYTGEMPGVGSTRTSRAIDKDYTIDDTLREYPITSNRISEIQNAQGFNNNRVDLNDWEGVTFDEGITKAKPGLTMMEEFYNTPIQKRISDATGYNQGDIELTGAVKDDFLQKQDWYNNPLTLRNNLLATGLSEDPLQRMQDVETFKQSYQGPLTISKYLDLSKQGKVPSTLQETFNEQVLENIGEAGGFGDTFPKNYSFGNIEPTFKGGRLDIDETQLDDDYLDRVKYLDLATGGRVGHNKGGRVGILGGF